MRTFQVTSRLLLFATLTAAVAGANPITITLTGTGSGSLGATAFNNAHFSFTMTTDTSLFVKPPCCLTRDTPSGTPAIFSIAGVGAGALTDNQVFFSDPSEALVGLAHFNDGDMIDLISPALSGYTFTTSVGPVTVAPDFVGACPGADCVSFTTSIGTLQFSSVKTVTFTATVDPPRTISHIADGAGFRTTFILLNTGNVAANFTLAFWADDGSALTLDLGTDGVTSALTSTIPPHGSRFIRTSGSTVDLNKGWAQLNAPPAINGNAIFGFQSPGQGDSEAAVPLSPGGSTDLFLPFDTTPGVVTGVAFANSDINGTVATISGKFLDDAATPIVDNHTVMVPKHGHDAEVMGSAAFFPATQGKRGAAHFSAGENIFGLGIRGNGKAFTSIEALFGVTNAKKTIAHIASGGGWKTTFLLVNPGLISAQFTLDFLGDSGSALPLQLDTGTTAPMVTGAIPAGGLRVVTALNAGDLKTGWAQLSVTGPISGTAIFGLETPGQSDSEAAVPLLLQGSTKLFMPFDYTTGYSTGVAFANPNANPAHVMLTLVDEGGNSVSVTRTVTIMPSGHTSLVLSDPTLFPDIAGERGTLQITSDQLIFGLGIRADGVAFTSLKVVAP